MNRRRFLQISSSVPISLASLGFASQNITTKFPLITVFLGGGISAKEFTNPDAPSTPVEFRGLIGSINTITPGVRFSAAWPRLAERQNQLSLVRSINSETTEHAKGFENHLIRKGRTVAEVWGEIAGTVPYVVLDQGHFASSYPSFRKQYALQPKWENSRFSPPELSSVGLSEQRCKLLDVFDDGTCDSETTKKLDRFRGAAADLLRGGGRFFEALRLNERDRQHYGSSLSGDLLLTSKQLVQAGAGAVTAVCIQGEGESDVGWDMHYNIASGMYERSYKVDIALSALVDEVHSGRLQAVIFVCSEFNRPPQINSNGGRDHWQPGNQAILVGGKSLPGSVHGRMSYRGDTVYGEVKQTDFSNTVLAVCGADLDPAIPRVREILK